MILKFFSILIFIQLVITDSFAGYGDSFGANTRNISLAGSSVLTDPGGVASRENPGALVLYKKVKLSLSYMDTDLNLDDIKSFRSTNPSSGITRDNNNPKNASNLRHLGFGFILPLSDYLTFGISGIIPADGLASIHAFTKHETNYLNYNDRQQRPEIYSALAVALSNGFSIGLGVFYALKVDGTVQLGVSSTDADARMYVRLRPEYIPYGGLLYQNNKYRVGFFYREKQQTDAHLNFDVDFDVGLGTIPFSAISNLTAYYDPRILSLGAGHIGEKINLFASIRKNYWSKYKAPIVKLAGKDINSLTGNTYSYEVITLQDTETYQLGMEVKDVINFKHVDVLLRTGIEYTTSALPSDPSSLAVVDTKRTSILFGTGFDVDSVGTFVKTPFRIDTAFQYSLLKSSDLAIVRNGLVVQSAHVGGNIFTFTTGVSFEF